MLKPDIDNADDGSMAGALRAFMDAYVRERLDDMLPAAVVSYDRASNRAVLQPLVMLGTTDGGKVSRARLANVPVFRFGGGGFFISVPLQPGDFGWVKASDRDISLVMQRGGLEDWPNTKRLHSFSDAMFFPDKLKGWLIGGKNADALVIQSLDGSTCIAVDNGRVEIDSSVDVKINAPTTTVTGDLVLQGNLSTSGGNVTMTGNITTLGTLTNNGKDIGDTHTHSGVIAGGDSTGPVV